jgi:hypothetical protein
VTAVAVVVVAALTVMTSTRRSRNMTDIDWYHGCLVQVRIWRVGCLVVIPVAATYGSSMLSNSESLEIESPNQSDQLVVPFALLLVQKMHHNRCCCCCCSRSPWYTLRSKIPHSSLWVAPAHSGNAPQTTPERQNLTVRVCSTLGIAWLVRHVFEWQWCCCVALVDDVVFVAGMIPVPLDVLRLAFASAFAMAIHDAEHAMRVLLVLHCSCHRYHRSHCSHHRHCHVQVPVHVHAHWDPRCDGTHRNCALFCERPVSFLLVLQSATSLSPPSTAVKIDQQSTVVVVVSFQSSSFLCSPRPTTQTNTNRSNTRTLLYILYIHVIVGGLDFLSGSC